MKSLLKKLTGVVLALIMCIIGIIPNSTIEAKANDDLFDSVVDAVEFSYNFYNSVQKFRGVKKATAKINHVKNVRACGIVYHGYLTEDIPYSRKQEKLAKTVSILIERGMLLPVNIGVKWYTSDGKSEDLYVAYVMSCLYDYEVIASYYGSDGLFDPIFTEFSYTNLDGSWSKYTSNGTTYKNASSPKTIYAALATNRNLNYWWKQSVTMRNLLLGDIEEMLDVATDFIKGTYEI